MITTAIPADWRALQDIVGQILSECGFSVEIEKQVQTVRGGVELDVFAEEDVQGRKYLTVCECKHWKARVPQNTVHGFRTVLADIGANVGYIISVSGFQEGAHKAAANTNVRLVTWDEFQAEFEATWFKKFMSPRITAVLDPLLTYAEPLLPAWFGDLSEERQQAFLDLKDRYDEFGWLIMSLTTYTRMLQDKPLPSLPFIDHIPPDSRLAQNVPPEVLRAVGLRDFLAEAMAFGEQLIEQFRAFRPDPASPPEEHY
jgi:restriction system protein